MMVIVLPVDGICDTCEEGVVLIMILMAMVQMMNLVIVQMKMLVTIIL